MEMTSFVSLCPIHLLKSFTGSNTCYHHRPTHKFNSTAHSARRNDLNIDYVSVILNSIESDWCINHSDSKSNRKVVWIHCDEAVQTSKEIFTAAIESGFSSILHSTQNQARQYSDLALHSPFTFDDSHTQILELDSPSNPIALWQSIESEAQQTQIMDWIKDFNSASHCRTLILDLTCTEWLMIPAENVLAAKMERFGDSLSSEFRVLAAVRTADEAIAMMETLQTGLDGVVLCPKDPKEVLELRSRIVWKDDADSKYDVELCSASVVSCRAIGSGDRVCIDTVSLLDVNEGLLVGNSSQGMSLILSEAAESEYVPSRPFRVNASAVHAYVLVPGGRTKYLSELRAGDRVLVVNSCTNSTRSVLVGRLKIEHRPMILLEMEVDTKRFSVLVQNAETVRIATPDCGPVPITKIRNGDTVFIRTDSSARHIGMAVKESLLER